MGLTRVFVLIFVAGCIACGGGGTTEVAPTPPPEPTTLIVYTVNYPLAYFAKRIGGDLVDVVLPVPAGIDPATWTPGPDTITNYQRADLILLSGAGYAAWVNHATLPMSKVVDTSAAFSDRWIALENNVTHSHGPEGEHAHAGWAFTTWLDPALAIEHARSIADAMVARRPQSESGIRARFAALESELQALDARYAAAAEIIGDEPLFFSHPVYQYVIDHYGLSAIELHWEPGMMPDGHAWDHLAEAMVEHPAKWMLWEGEPLAATVTALDERGIGSLLFDPCGKVPETGDYLTVMDANAGSLETIAETINGDVVDDETVVEEGEGT
jgi:zinc transport system substrate-binding protein